jgi:hypothetical protein
MALAASGRSVHHIPLAYVQRYLHERCNVDVFSYPEWYFELLTMEVILHPHCLRASRSLLGSALVDPKHREKKRRDFGPPPVPSRPRGAVDLDFEAPSWSFDPTLGFPGEGPDTLTPP